MPKHCVLVVLDGLGDRACPQLGNLTPLQAAAIPFLDSLAQAGGCGLYHAGMLGQALPSENAHFAMFGYGPEEFPGRGWLEALGQGLAPEPGSVAVLAHLCAVSERQGSLYMDVDAPQAAPEECAAAAAAVARFSHAGVDIRFEHGKGLFGVLVLSGDVSPRVTDSNTMRDNAFLSAILPHADHAADPAARRTARALAAYVRHCHRTLRNLPLNHARRSRGLAPLSGLVTQRPGADRQVMPFAERYGMRGVSVSAGVIYWGIARYLGLDLVQDPDSGDPGADLARRLDLARKEMAQGAGFVHVHTKAPDEAAHRKDPLLKLAAIESLDRGLAKGLPPLLDDPEVLVAVTADHSTPSVGTLVHSGEPVPLVFHGPGVRQDAVSRFDEASVAAGCLGCVRGGELMLCILNYLDRARLAGIVDAPRELPYWPGPYDPFPAQPPREEDA